jgi:oligosaccharide reducing-end xylanase
MRNSTLCPVILLACGIVGCTAPTAVKDPATSSAAEPSGPAALLAPPKVGAFVSGKYRNVFTELGYPEGEVKTKVENAYANLFHGKPEEEAVMFDAGNNEHGKLAYIKDIGNGDVRSEGMSYGMMIAVQLNQKADFDALWNWSTTFMLHTDPNHPAYGYFAWQMRDDGTRIDDMPAPDGEEYFITALLFAANRWGSGEGKFNYAQQANTLLDRVKNRDPIKGLVNGTRETTGVALFNAETKMVRFTPDSGNFEKNTDHTDPSYHLPSFYELWALWGPEPDRAFWREAATVSRDFFVKSTHPKTGLSPDYAHFDGTPKAASWDANTVQFRFDAFRTGMNWAMDCAWFAKDPRQIELSDRLLNFFAHLGKTYPNTYHIDGTATSTSSSSGLIATNATVTMCATTPKAAQFVEALWRQPVPTGKWRYYDGMLYMFALLHLSGTFQIHTPSAG